MSGTTLDISEARRQFNSLDKRLDSDQIIYITRHGKEAFAIVNMDYLRAVLETMDILSDPDAMRMLGESLDDIRNARFHDHDEVEQELG